MPQKRTPDGASPFDVGAYCPLFQHLGAIMGVSGRLSSRQARVGRLGARRRLEAPSVEPPTSSGWAQGQDFHGDAGHVGPEAGTLEAGWELEILARVEAGHQTRHTSSLYRGLPAVQAKACRNSGMLMTRPFTRYLFGECGSVIADSLSSSGRVFSHAH